MIVYSTHNITRVWSIPMVIVIPKYIPRRRSLNSKNYFFDRTYYIILLLQCTEINYAVTICDLLKINSEDKHLFICFMNMKIIVYTRMR